MNLAQITSKLTPRGWLMVGGSAAVALAFVFLLFSMASTPSYTTLLAGVDPAQTGKITSALSAQGISYQLENNGTAIGVQASQEAQARVALATAGLLGAGSGTQSPLAQLGNNSSLGQSQFQQSTAYQAALEQQLVSTIDNIQGVSSAQVQLVLPNPTSQLFDSSQTPSTASVLLTDSGSLDPNSIKGIASLVAGAVPGLTTSKVTIADQTGAQLWPAGSAAGGALPSKQQAENAYDQAEAMQLDAMLAQTLGPNKAQVAVNADLNTDQTTQQTLTYANKGVPLTTTTSQETLAGGSGAASGVAGLTGTRAGTVTGSGASKYTNKSSQINYGVNKTVTSSQVSAGKVNRQSVSVLVASSVPKSEIPALQAAVTAAAGLVKSRGDALSIQQIPFAKQAPASSPSSPTAMLGYAKYALAGIGALVFLFFVTRLLRRRETEAFAGQPTWLRELEAPRSLAAVEAAQGLTPIDNPTQIMQLRAPLNVAKKQVEDLVDREPDRVAAQVRVWMSED